MPGLFSRLKTWSALENLTDEELNAEVNNIIQNFVPQMMDDYSANVSQMQTQTTPGSVGSESLAVSLAEEIERIRYMLALITGKTYWYQAPDRSLAASGARLGFYLPFDGGATQEARNNSIIRGAICNALSQTSEDFVAGDISSSQAKFGNYSYTMGAANVLAVAGDVPIKNIGTLSTHFYNIGASEHIAYNPLLGIELYTDSFGKLNAKITKKTTTSETAKATSEIAGSSSVTGVASWKHVLLKYVINSLNGSGADQLALKLNGSNEGTQLTAQTIGINGGNGGAWFFGSKRNDPTWGHASEMKVVPSAEATNPWTKTGVGSTTIGSDGILTIAAAASEAALFSKTNPTGAEAIDLANTTIEFKFKINSLYNTNTANPAFTVYVRDDSMNRSLNVDFKLNAVTLQSAGGATSKPFPIDASNWHVYRIVISGSPSPTATLYVDGVKYGSLSLADADSTANDLIAFGDDSTSSNCYSTVEVEFFRYTGAAATVPIAAGTSGSLDDIAMIMAVTDSATDTSLSSSKASTVLGHDKEEHKFYQYQPMHDTTVTAKAVAAGAIGDFSDTLYAVSDGRTPISVSWSVSGSFAAGTRNYLNAHLSVGEPNGSSDPSSSMGYGYAGKYKDADRVYVIESIGVMQATGIYPAGVVKIVGRLENDGSSGGTHSSAADNAISLSYGGAA